MLPSQMRVATSSAIRLINRLSQSPRCKQQVGELYYLTQQLHELHGIAKYETANRMTPEQVRHLHAIRQSIEEIMLKLPHQELKQLNE